MSAKAGIKSTSNRSDFSQGSVCGNIMYQSLPLIVAQLVQLLYNVIDRVYIGHLPVVGSTALTGIGLAFPLTTLIAAFTNLFSTGCVPLFSMARGAKDEKRAELILGQAVTLLVGSSLILFVICFAFRDPILWLFGATEDSFGYAEEYLSIYLFGTTFSMFSTGMNGFINAQGFPKTGMCTIAIGAVLNLVLDPIFIFVFDMGVAGAAIATVISQAVSALWVLTFFLGKRSMYRIRKANLILRMGLLRQILGLGLAGFIMQATNFLVQIVCNKMLNIYGGDLYVGIMTVVNSVRDILSLPANSIANGAQPVLGYNYGAKKFDRVRRGIRFTTFLGFAYMLAAWLFVLFFPHLLLSIFTSDQTMISTGQSSLHIYFFGFFFMAFQFAGQSTFTALGCAKRAIFFSLLRKVLIVVPLTLLLPGLGFGTDGVFLAEPISNVIGGLASFLTMYFTLYRRLPKQDDTPVSKENLKVS